MTFRKAVIEIKAAAVGTGIKATLRASKKLKPQLNLTISAVVAKQLGWSNNDRLEVMMGEGEHHGLVRLRKNNSAGQARVQETQTGKGPFFTLKLGHQEIFIDQGQPAAWCMWEQITDDGSWVEVSLPRWADKTADRVVSKASVSPALAPTPAAPKGQYARARDFGNSIAKSKVGA